MAHAEGKPLKLHHNHQYHGFDDVFKQKQKYLGSGKDEQSDKAEGLIYRFIQGQKQSSRANV